MCPVLVRASIVYDTCVSDMGPSRGEVLIGVPILNKTISMAKADLGLSEVSDAKPNSLLCKPHIE